MQEDRLPFEDADPVAAMPDGPAAATALIHVNPDGDPAVVKLHQEALALLGEAKALVITDPAGLKPATDSLVMIKGLKGALEEARVGYTRPINAHLTAVNAAFKVLTNPLDEADDTTRNKVLAFRAGEEAKRKEQERINAMREEVARSEMALKGELTEPVGLQAVAPELHRTSMTNMGSTGTRTTWKWEVEDLAKIPMEYLMVDAAKVGKLVRAGMRRIPGIRIFDEEGLAVRGRTG